MRRISLQRGRWGLLCGSIGWQRFEVEPDREAPRYNWIRVGLLPGWGTARGPLILHSFCSITFVRPDQGLYFQVAVGT